MKSKNLFHAIVFVLAVVAGNMIAVTAAAQDRLAPTREYKAIDDSLIGTRDGDLGVQNGHQIEQDIVILNIENQDVSLKELWSEQPLMIVFYRGGWCPYCNLQSRELAENYGLFEAENVLPILISVDKPDASALMSATYEIPFPVLSDQDLVAHSEFNVVRKMSQQEIDRSAQRGRDASAWSDRDHQSYAVASSFLIDTQGKVQWSTVLEDYTKRPSIDQLITAISDWKTK